MKRVNNKWRDSGCWIGGDQRLELKTESGGLMNENQTCQWAARMVIEPPECTR